ncbi:MAG: DUF192 domain-containing protein [Candidatus Aureabacteria bacterium]|nr:DUF192 domain-containing protein [Candidatus Auribacterota bacterium]
MIPPQKQCCSVILVWLLCLATSFSENISIRIGDKTLQVEVVRSNRSRKKGLQGRKFLKENSGMLFIFNRPQILQFWMKKTRIPLSIAFLDEEKKILQIEDLFPYDLKSVKSKEKCLYALEVNLGWFKKNQVKPGLMMEFTS